MPNYAAIFKDALRNWVLPASRRKQVLSIEIKPSYRCNQNCVMCPYEEKSGTSMTADEILHNLDFVRKEFDFEELVISGGEPTVHPEFFTMLDNATQHFPDKQLIIHTNAIRFADRSFAARIPNRARVRAFVSLHAPEEDTNRRITSVPRGHERIVQGIRNLKERGVEVWTDTVIVALNQYRLKEIGDLLLALKIDSAEIRLPHLLGGGRDRFYLPSGK